MTNPQPSVVTSVVSGVRTQPSHAGKLPSTYSQLAEGLLLALPAAAVTALPAAIRAAGFAHTTLLMAWFAATGPAALVLGPTVALARTARPWPPAASAALMAVVLSTGPLALLGNLLKATTHHRPLGAVTFSILALLTVAGAVVLTSRAAELIRGLEEGRRRAARIAAVAVVALSPAVAVVLLRGAFRDPLAGPLGYALLDGLLALALGIAAGWVRIPRLLRPSVRRAGPTLWVLTVVTGLWAVDRAGLGDALEQISPMLGWAATWIV
jgi:hypothetical protein